MGLTVMPYVMFGITNIAYCERNLLVFPNELSLWSMEQVFLCSAHLIMTERTVTWIAVRCSPAARLRS